MKPAVVVAALALFACSGQQLGFPRVQISATSPDGRYVAFVRNHPNLDPPDQTLWIGEVSGAATKIRQLGEDSQWCNRVTWSADSTTATFVVEGTANYVERVTVDAKTRKIVTPR